MMLSRPWEALRFHRQRARERELAAIEARARRRYSSDHRIYVDAERTILLTLYANGRLTVATRDDPDELWGPPIELMLDDVVWR
jgi:hypothetical protein